ncbi:hypothetical protein HanPSC8_Chr02g0058681 [Helianthus annuus]|nr:hypothetical protein HanPSC8_Chr02g0058681 [Helianthus annuus]
MIPSIAANLPSPRGVEPEAQKMKMKLKLGFKYGMIGRKELRVFGETFGIEMGVA